MIKIGLISAVDWLDGECVPDRVLSPSALPTHLDRRESRVRHSFARLRAPRQSTVR